MQQKTPTEQAIIQFLESIVITALIAGIVSISDVLLGNGPINVQQTAISFGLAFAFSLAHSLAAYLKALPAPGQTGQADYSALGTVFDSFLSALQQRLEAVNPVQVVQVQPQVAPTTAQPQSVAATAPKAQSGQVNTATPTTIPVAPSAPATIDWNVTGGMPAVQPAAKPAQ